MKKAVIYARYSSEKQNEQSIEGQIDVATEYADRNGITIVDTYVDRALSGRTDKRPEFQRMLKDSDKKLWDIVLVYKLDRFSRNKYEMAIHKKHLRDNGIKIVSATENIPDSPEGIILESLLEGMAEYYSAELSQKIKRGITESLRKGKYVSGRPPYGYRKLPDQTLVIEESEASVIRALYSAIINGTSVPEIVEKCNANNLEINGAKVIPKTIYHLLKNEAYTGYYTHNDEIFDKVYPPIIDKATFKRVRCIINEYEHKGRHSNTTYILREKLYCGYCGKAIHVESGRCRNGSVKRYYKCSTRKSGHKCKLETIRKEDFEAYILDILRKMFCDEKNKKKACDMIINIRRTLMKKHLELTILEDQKKDIELSIHNIILAIEQGIINETVNNRLKELQDRLDILTISIASETSNQESYLSQAKLSKGIDITMEKNDKYIIRDLIDYIKLYNNKVKIHLGLEPKAFGQDRKEVNILIYEGKSIIKTSQMRKNGSKNIPIKLYIYYN